MIKPKNKGKGRPQVACIACLYSCGFGAKRIAAVTHYTSAAVTKVMHRHGLPMLSTEQRRKISVNKGLSRGGPFSIKSTQQLHRNIAKAIRHSRVVFKEDIKAVEREKDRIQYRMNYRTVPAFMIKARLRRRVRKVLESQGAMKKGSTLGLIGCSSEHLKKHIESQFKEGMDWDNYGLWHIDHIRPCASFDLMREEEQRACFHWTNLQPLWAKDNQTKSDRWDGNKKHGSCNSGPPTGFHARHKSLAGQFLNFT